MSVIDNAIKVGSDNSLSFGNYQAEDKQKVKDYEVIGDIYNLKTHKLVTRLEKNNKLLVETVPGATVHNLLVNEDLIIFSAEGNGNTQITFELEPETEYKIKVAGDSIGVMQTNLSGKLSFSTELKENPCEVKIKKL